MAVRQNRDIPPIACVTRPVPHQVKAMSAIAKALRDKGCVVRETYDRTPPESIVFAWSWKWCKEILEKHPSTIVCTLDHGLLHPRNETTVTGWMGLNGMGEHPVVDDDGARLRKMGWDNKVAPWRQGGRTALIVGQCYNDVQILDHLEDYGSWLMERSEELREGGWDVQFRPHPVQRRNDLSRYPRFAPITQGKTIHDDINQLDVGLVLGFNSNSLLDAFMAGVPRIHVHNRGSMLWPITDRHALVASVAHRQVLVERLAYCQWTPAEIANGEWAEYHLPIMRRLVEGQPHRPWFETLI